MSEAFERAASRLANREGLDFSSLKEPGKYLFREEVRAVLEAIREPDEAMLDAGGHSDGTLPISEYECKVFPAVIWRAMIDELLRDADPQRRTPRS